MIYNFSQYFKNEFPTETIYTNGRVLIAGQETIPDRNVLLIETGGTETAWFKYVQKTIQVLTRDTDVTDARDLSWDIFNKITSVFGLILPLVIVDGITYNEIQTAQINGIQQPYCLGSDDEGRMEFTTNYQVIYRR